MRAPSSAGGRRTAENVQNPMQKRLPDKTVYPATSILAAAAAGFGHPGDLRAKVPPNEMSRGVAGEKNPTKTYVNVYKTAIFDKGVKTIVKPC